MNVVESYFLYEIQWQPTNVEVIQLIVNELHECSSIFPFTMFSSSLRGFSVDFGILLSKIQAHTDSLLDFL